jgi:hypothetical protein
MHCLQTFGRNFLPIVVLMKSSSSSGEMDDSPISGNGTFSTLHIAPFQDPIVNPNPRVLDCRALPSYDMQPSVEVCPTAGLLVFMFFSCQILPAPSFSRLCSPAAGH